MVVLFNLARVVGALLSIPPDVLGPHLPMVAPLPRSLADVQHRRRVDQSLSTAWNQGDGYEVQPSDDWIVNGSLFRHDMDRPSASTYGEITSRGARQLFDVMGMTSSSTTKQTTTTSQRDVVFWDLGSGAGKLVVQSYLELPRIQRSVGIELAPSRHESAVKAWEGLVQSGLADELRSNHPHAATKNDDASLELIVGDLFHADVSEATHIYVSSLCFTDDMMRRLEEKLTCSSSKVKSVASLREFPRNLFGTRPRVEYMEMSWTKRQGTGCAVYVYSPT